METWVGFVPATSVEVSYIEISEELTFIYMEVYEWHLDLASRDISYEER
jgi:hypothetical protein